MEYKKITEVEMIEEPSENATVLAEDDGKLRRVPFKNVGGNGGGLPAGGAPHQMLVTDADGKTVWDERTHWVKTDVLFEWDGNTNGRVSFEIDTVRFVKVSDVALTADDVIGSTLRYVGADIINTSYPDAGMVEYNTITENEIMMSENGILSVCLPTVERPFVISFSTAFPDYGATEAGTYVEHTDHAVITGGEVSGITYVGELKREGVHRLDKKYLPENTVLAEADGHIANVVYFAEKDVTDTVICTPKAMPTEFNDSSMTVEGHLNIASNYYDSMRVELVATGEFVAGSRTYEAQGSKMTENVTYTMETNPSGQYLDIVFEPLQVAYAPPNSSNPSSTSLWLEGLRIWGHGSGNMVFDRKLSNYESGDFSLTVTLQATATGVKAHESIPMWSTTEGSTKRFKITVDDSGNLTATEVTS